MRLIFAIAVSLAITGATFADTINVPGDHPTIQEAVDASNNGDEIIVAPGRYTSIQDGHVVDMMGKAITLRSSDGPEVTIIDGENARRGIACFSGETESTLIEGFTITNGNSTWYDYDNNGKASDWWENDGGGIICYNNSSPSILNCLIRNSTSNDDGGGLACHLNSNPLVSNCVITGNTAASYDSTGGGIACNSSRPTLTHCLISENTALRNGGGASFVGALGSDAIITHCTISGNYALGDTFGGGGIYCYKSSPTITSCEITGNTASSNGGGFFCNNESYPIILECNISNNIAQNTAGGIYHAELGTSDMTDTIVCGNDPDQIYGDWTDNGGNTIADECPDCPGDATGDGLIDVNDVLYLISTWNTADPNADFDEDGLVDADDVLILLSHYGAPCP